VLKPDTQLQVEQLLKSVAQAPRSLLLLDYDGTLAPFHQERDQAFPYSGIPEVLQEIIRGGHTRVVIISGRDTSETIPLLGLDPFPEVWGLHGMQRQKPDGRVEMLRLEESYLNALSDADRWLSYQQLRHTAEFKTGSIAVHWRGLSEWGVEELRGRVLLGWKAIADHAGMEYAHPSCGQRPARCPLHVSIDVLLHHFIQCCGAAGNQADSEQGMKQPPAKPGDTRFVGSEEIAAPGGHHDEARDPQLS